MHVSVARHRLGGCYGSPMRLGSACRAACVGALFCWACTTAGLDDLSRGGQPAGHTGGAAGATSTGGEGGEGTDASTGGAPETGGSPATGGSTPDASAGGTSDGGSSAGGAADSGSGGGGGAGGTVEDGTAVGVLGAACSTNDAHACAGHAAKGQLFCKGGKWAANGTCTSTNDCDTTPGPNAGSCQPIVDACAGQAPGSVVCRGADRLVCGSDSADDHSNGHMPLSLQRGNVRRRLHSGNPAVRRLRARDVRRYGHVAAGHRLRHRLHRGSVHRSVQPDDHGMQRAGRADLRRERRSRGHFRLHRPGVRVRRLRGHLHARNRAMRGEWRRDLLVRRSLGRARALYGPSLRLRRLHGRLRARRDHVLGQRGSVLHRLRSVERARGVREPGLLERRLHGLVRTGNRTL